MSLSVVIDVHVNDGRCVHSNKIVAHNGSFAMGFYPAEVWIDGTRKRRIAIVR